jgi:magnesium chelatase family protein
LIATVPSATLLGIDGQPVSVEVHIGNGLPAFTVVGLPDAACRESRDRVRAAFASTGLDFPKTRITVNLAPSGLRKVGSGLDLPMAVAVLAAAGRLDARALADCAFIGELGLDGAVRPVHGVLSLVDAAAQPTVVVPSACAAEARLVAQVAVRSVSSLRQLVAALDGSEPWPEVPAVATPAAGRRELDLAEVRGQPLGHWAIEVSAAGGHHLLLVGPPGAGKTMLAGRLPGVLPPLAPREALETTRIHSAGGLTLPVNGLVTQPPFRAPHHSASVTSLIGGGSTVLRPGEVSFATNGV